jgi:hypothetical protein
VKQNRLSEALALAETILRNIELSELPLENICLKTSRLARLLNDDKSRQFYTQSSSTIGQYEAQLETDRIRLSSTSDPDVSISSANPNQMVFNPMGNFLERKGLDDSIRKTTQLIHVAKSNIFTYVLNVYHQLRFSSVPEEIFERTRKRVDLGLAQMVPEAVEKFVSVFDNLKSENPEDWSNAVGSCRRILKAVADVLYPPNPEGAKEINRSGKKIQVGPDNYINRLMLYVEERSDSRSFHSIVGSHLDYIGDRLDAIHKASHKGAHTDIQTVDEAERYIVFTYLLIGDLLQLQT